jgi:Mn2+/Fe2+ NRAMP family transporter
MRRLSSVLFWSVIAAVFIGPGTVTTAASAGAAHRYALLWALGFSTVACLVLQEAAARIAAVSGHDLAEALSLRFRHGWRRATLLVLVLGAVVLGCAAYQAGNILGAVAGASLRLDVGRAPCTLAIGAVAALLLAYGGVRTVARLLGMLVAVMGVAFLVTAWRLAPDPDALLRGALLPRLPAGSGWLAIGLVGTTVVPYNLFLGSGLARGERLGDVRFGLAVAILLGGAISMGVVVVGAAIEGGFAFSTLSGVLERRLGPGASWLFAVGLFAAGLSSAVTAPLAAAVTARGLLGAESDPRWGERSARFRSVWGAVLLVGVGFGLADVQPVPAIVVAQALNGILLPVVAIYLLLAVNDRRLLGDRLNGALANTMLVAVVLATFALGLRNVAWALSATFGLVPPGELRVLWWSAAIALLAAGPVGRALRAARGQRRRAT